MPRSILVAFRENEPDRHCVLDSQSALCVIGRGADANLTLPDSTVSRRHAVVRLDKDTLHIEDCGSTNGIFINGQKVERSVMREGDFLTLGAYTLVMRTLGEGDEVSPPQGVTALLDHAAARRMRDAILQDLGSEHAAALYKATLLLGELHDLDELLRQTLALVVESLTARRGAIVIQEDALNAPRIAARISLMGEMDELFLSRTLVEHALRTRSAFLTENAQTDPRFSNSQAVKQRGIRAVMCAPLIGTQEMVGVFYIDTCERSSGFTEKELEFLTAVGNLVGMAIENKIQNERMIRQQRLAAMGQAIAGICHDVRSVLTGVTIGVETLEAQSMELDAAKIAKACRLVSKSANHLETYITNLLTFAKETDIRRSPSNVAGIIHDVLEMMRPSAAEYGVELTYRGAELCTASIDALQLERVLANLVRNAIDACRSQGGTVTVSASQKADALQVKVGDTGAGIAAEDVPHLSEPFFTTKGRSGTGLGLAVSYRIVEQHGGSIAVASEMGKGTIFRITIPGCFSQESEPAATASQPPDTSDELEEVSPSVFSTPYPLLQ
ncbi:MAG: GAF domain-containing protein [Candidatus Hydrogenedentes bacterium]|nr:GAF domain-containing protein [Candidatus Hydrogenedentota bacterium]